MTNQQPDLVTEARARLANPRYGMGKRNRELMTQLCDEVDRLRSQAVEDKAAFDELVELWKKAVGEQK